MDGFDLRAFFPDSDLARNCFINQPPSVDMHVLYGNGIPTAESFYFDSDSDFPHNPKIRFIFWFMFLAELKISNYY